MKKLRKDDTGASVRELQKLLGIEADGWYGEATESAVRRTQEKFGLTVDGIAGDQTMAALRTGKPDPKHLTHAAIVAAAKALSVDTGTILAVTEVEAAGDGFLPDGRPDILFERHVMYKRLEDAGLDAADLANKYSNIVNPKRGGYAGGPAEHSRFKTATGIHFQCAVESASWGMFQIMGYHWETLGYGSAGEFVSAMSNSEADQLDAFIRFIKSSPALHKALKARKWPDFARLYNGPAYKENLYDFKLAAAYERHATANEVPA